MVHSFQPRLKAFVAEVAALLLLALAGNAECQVLRGPDLGLWFRQERDASGADVLIVDDLLADCPFAAAGLRAGDRIISVDGTPIDSEPQFVRGVMKSSNGDHVVSLVVTRTDSGTALGNTVQQTISLKARDVWNGAVAADPFYEAGFLVDERNPDAVIVLRVFPLTPAFYAGLRAADTITSVSGQTVKSSDDVPQYLRVGGRLALGVTRGGEPRQLHILLPRHTATHTTYPAERVQPPSPLVPNYQPPPLPLVPPQIPGPLSPIPSALPRSPQNRQRVPF